MVFSNSATRSELRSAFKRLPGGYDKEIISPIDVTKKHYDIIICDEAHRLRRNKNLGMYITNFRSGNTRLGLDDTHDELDWLVKNSDCLVLLYDRKQIACPSDIPYDVFHQRLDISHCGIRPVELQDQMRIRAGNDYVPYIHAVLNQKQLSALNFKNYEFKIFCSFSDKQPFFNKRKLQRRETMPRKKKEVLKTCGKIETQFPAHVTQTEIAISKLKDAELIDPKTVSYYATKLRECRERIGLTETSVGNLLNLSHVSIVGYENALRPRASIDRTYLKLFALIYDVSPLYLVGKTDNPLDYTGEFPVEKFLPTITEPIMFALSCANSTPRPPALIYADEAVMALYKDGVLASKEDRELMQVFLRICDAKDKRHEVIKNALFGIPLIQRLFQKIGDEAFAKERRTDIKSNRCERITEKDPYHILETIFTLEKLGYKDLDLLKCFLAITRGTPEEKLFVLRFLRDGGFIDESSSFVQNNRATKLQSLSDLAFTHTEQD